jgi:hypothetical protein
MQGFKKLNNIINKIFILLKQKAAEDQILNHKALKYRIIILFLLMSALLQNTNAQFVGIEIEVPAGNEIKIMTDSSNLQWMGITLDENLEIITSVIYKPFPGREIPVQSFYLNDGTFNLSQAIPFCKNRADFSASSSGRLIRNMSGHPTGITFWIGLQLSLIKELTLEFN